MAKKTNTPTHTPPTPAADPPKKPVPVVALGGSAGGMEAFSQFLQHVSPATGFAFVYVQHLAPDHESMLADILAKHTRMPVVQAKEAMPIAPNTVYVIPPNKDMEIVDGVLTLLPRRAKPFLHLPIDQFFISLAERQKEGAIGVVLSGADSDGTLGLKAIKAAGGVTFAQDETARFQGMPRSAIMEGVVDLVLSPPEIARELELLSSQTSRVREVLLGNIPETAIVEDDEDLRTIIQLLRKTVQVDFSHYKMNTLKRRIVRRMLLHKQETLKDYAQFLRQNPPEIHTLYNDLLINVTTFFRDEETFEYLKKHLLPRIIQGKGPNDPIRIWVPACATGEEAYSLAIVLTELLSDRPSAPPVQIFATDLSESAINKARLGAYNRNELVDMSPNRLQRFFIKADGHYRITKSIRDCCVFAPHNVFKDPPFSRLDLVSCCNLLIYLDTVLQKKVLSTFHYALNPGGHLVLGKSETIGSSTHLFAQLEKNYKVYMRRGDASSSALFDMSQRIGGAGQRADAPVPPRPLAKIAAPTNDLEKIVDSVLLNQYVPASVVVNADLDILQFRGSTSLFLEPSPGKASLNLLKMARPGLTFELRTAVHKVHKTGLPLKKSGLEIKNKGISHLVSFEVTPLKTEAEELLFLIIFEEMALPATTSSRSNLTRDRRIKQLEEELATVREDMRSIIEEQEATNEELQSANEEIVSSNEELQSINEELETSKEEVESSNEELMTINQELQVRNDELAEAYEYIEAMFTTVREAAVVLDENLRIRVANGVFYQMFRVRREEEIDGQLIYEINYRQWNIPSLRRLLDEILPEKNHAEGYEITHHFPGIGEKVLVLNARRITQTTHRRQVILLAIEDITEHRRAQQVLSEREAWFRNMADNAPVMLWVAGKDKRYTFLNRTWLQFTGHTMEQELANGWFEGVHRDDRELCLGVYATHFERREPFRLEYRLRRHDGEYRWVLDVGIPTYWPDGQFSGFMGTCTDIQTQRALNLELEHQVQKRTQSLMEVNAELKRSNDELEQFAYVASHDLQEPLRKIITFSDLLMRQHREALTKAGQGHVDKIAGAAQRMSQLIEDLLNFSRAAREVKEFVPINLNDVLRHVLEDFDLIVREKNAVIECDPLPTLPANALQMTQLFHNLLSNALKFTGDKAEPRITISVERPTSDIALRHCRDHQPESCWEIVVRDNGIGFKPGFAEQIFVIFQRLHDKDYPGTGIGLALCRRIVNNHGGEIFAVGEEGKGAEFHVVMPEKAG